MGASRFDASFLGRFIFWTGTISAAIVLLCVMARFLFTEGLAAGAFVLAAGVPIAVLSAAICIPLAICTLIPVGGATFFVSRLILVPVFFSRFLGAMTVTSVWVAALIWINKGLPRGRPRNGEHPIHSPDFLETMVEIISSFWFVYAFVALLVFFGLAGKYDG